MVHRIQNRNPGYSDFGTTAGTTSFNFQNTNSNPISDGATALKLENEIVSESIQSQSVDDVNNQYHVCCWPINIQTDHHHFFLFVVF